MQSPQFNFRHFHHPKVSSIQFLVIPDFLLLTQATTDLFHICINFPSPEITYKWNCIFIICIWLLSLGKGCLKFIHFVACINSPFLYRFVVCIIPIFVYLTTIVVGHLDYFHFLAIMSNAAMNINLQVSVWMYIFISLG